MNKTICIVLAIILILVVIRAISTGGRLWGDEENYRRGWWSKITDAVHQLNCSGLNQFKPECRL